MIYILYGHDDYSLRQALKEIKDGLGSADLVESNTTVLDGGQVTMERLRTACDAAPFFAPNRLVVVEGLLGRFESRHAGRNEPTSTRASDLELAESLEQYARQVPPSTVLVLVDGDIRPGNPLLKRLAAAATVKVFAPLRGDRLHSWVQDRVSAAGCRISPSAVRVLAEMSGDDLWSLSNEIEKLVLYSQGAEIGPDEVRQVLSSSREANQFAMLDAIMARQADVALKLLHQLLDEGARAAQILGFVSRELGLLLRAREALEQGRGREEVQARLSTAPGFRTDKILRTARSADLGRLKGMYVRILQADLAIKTGALSEELALDVLMAQMCRRQRKSSQQ